jgi:hypothetical protein
MVAAKGAHKHATRATIFISMEIQITPVGDASQATDEFSYSVTVGQALEHFLATRRKPPSQRTIQRYCIEGRLVAQKIRTSYGAEWLINEESLNRMIEAEPIVTGDAGVAVAPVLSTLAPPSSETVNKKESDTFADGDASVADNDMASPAGERRSVGDVLIENARLLAQVEGRDQIIAELKEDRDFLREEVREARRNREDVRSIAERMLDTLKSVAIGRISAPAASPSNEPVQATIIEPETQRPWGSG